MIKSTGPKSWTLAIIEAGGALLILIGSMRTLSPDAPAHFERFLAGILIACVIVTLARMQRMDDRALLTQAAIGIAITGALIASDATNRGVFLSSAGFLWIGLWAAAFFPQRTLRLCLAGELLAILAGAPLSHAPLQVLALSGTVFCVSVVASAILARVIGDLRREAHLDQLTGLHNRHGIKQVLDELDWRRNGARPISLVVFDLDGLKNVNDHAGHVAGDRLLATFAAELSQSSRAGDVTARIGGDEFLAILPGATAGEAGNWTADLRLRSAVAWSFGIAQRLPDEPFEAWLGRADDCLYETKAARKGVEGAGSGPAVDVRLDIR